MISERLLTAEGLLRPEFRPSQQSAMSSETFISQELIIQKRSATLYPAWKQRMKILAAITDPEGLLSAAQCQHHLDQERGCFWVQYQRQDLPDSPSEYNYQQLSAAELNSIFQETLPIVIATERLLAAAGEKVSAEDYLLLATANSSKIDNARQVDSQRIAENLAYFGVKITAPLPRPGRLFLSHGDVLPKNIIHSNSGYRLIDWEALNLYPREMTLSHGLVWLLRKMAYGQRWEWFLQENLPRCQELTARSPAEAYLDIYWQLLREAFFWSSNIRAFRQRIAESELFWEQQVKKYL